MNSATLNVTNSDSLATVTGLVKDFPGTRALDHVDFALGRGEIHALCGENGAGKSVFVKILSGEYHADEGQILFDGLPYKPSTPAAAERIGIVRVAQEPALVPGLSVAENTYLGHLPRKRSGLVEWKQLARDAAAQFERLGIPIDVHAKANSLSVAQQQVVCIAAALVHDAKLLILDEPTSTITEVETRALFRIMKTLKEADVSILFISHRLEEVFQISDVVTVFRDGQNMGTSPTGDVSRDEIVRRMVGRDVLVQKLSGDTSPGEEVLAVRNLTKAGFYEDISFELHQGEVLTLAGLTGSGRTSVAQTLFGVMQPDTGQILLDGKQITIASPTEAIRLGIGLAPEDRKLDALALSLSVRQNLTVLLLDQLSTYAWMRRADENQAAREMVRQVDVRTSGVNQSVGNLSGGNQQKVVLGRWLLKNPRILIVDEPTRGIDVGAKSEIHKLMRRLAAGGMAIIMISSELPEVLSVSDRVIVLHEGRVTGRHTHAHVTEEKIVANASGVERHE